MYKFSSLKFKHRNLNWTLRDKDEQGIEQSHLNATQQTTSKGASPPGHREMEALRVVTYNWLALGCGTGPEAACLCNRRGSMPWGKQEQ